MTNKRIIHQHLDGSLSITIPARVKGNGETEQEYLDAIAAKLNLPDAIRLLEVLVSELPQSRRFRNMWRESGGAIAVDMPLARTQRMSEIREERDGKLIEADGPTTREMEQSGTDYTAWKVYKQALRDLPAATDLSKITTPEALEAFNPTWPTPPGK